MTALAMTREEAMRRLKALLDMSQEDRPISIRRLEKLAGFNSCDLYKISRQAQLSDKAHARLSIAFTLLENDQISIKHRALKGFKNGRRIPSEVTIGTPKPPLVMVKRVRFTPAGAKIEFVPTNPLAFPDLTPKKD